MSKKNNRVKLAKEEVISASDFNSLWVGLDHLHFTWDRAFSYNKTWNFAVGERESGKSVNSWIKLYNAFYFLHRPSIVLRRRIADMTSAYIDDIATLLNKFLAPDKRIQLLYLKGDVSSGIADIHVGKAEETYTYASIKSLPILFRIIGLSAPMNRIKSMLLSNVRYMFIDEMIANVRGGESYLTGDEHFLIQEIYTTYNREAETPIRIIGAGNPYSVYCPLFSGLGVDSSKLKPGAFVVGPNYVIDCFQTPPELKAMILRNNPLYEFDDSYRRYAFGGESINDQNIRIQKTEPSGFKLRWVFKLGTDFLTVHWGKAKKKDKEPFTFWVCKHGSSWLKQVSKRRKMVVFNYADLVEGAYKWSPSDGRTFGILKEAMNKRQVTYNCVDASYMLEDVSMYF